MVVTTPAKKSTASERRRARAGSEAIPAKATRGETLRGLLADPWRKVASLILAALLWMHIDSQLTKIETVSCELKVVTGLQTSATRSEMQVILDSGKWTAGEFVNASDEPVARVDFTFKGNKDVIDTIDQDREILSVRKLPEIGASYIDFDVHEVRPGPGLPPPVKMTPSRIRLKIEANAEEERTLIHSDVAVTYHPATVSERALVKETTFQPASVTLQGTEKNLGKIIAGDPLFELDLTSQPDAVGPTEIKASVRLRPDIARHQIECDPTYIEVTIPLKPEWKEPYPVLVPVQLITVGTPFTSADLEPIPDVKITFWATGTIASELGASEAEAQAWANRYMVLMVAVPAEIDDLGANIRPRLWFHEPNADLQAGLDYKAEIPVITVKRKNR